MCNDSTDREPAGRLYEIGVDVGDLDRAAQFWSSVLGLKVANRESQYVNFERQGDWPRVYLQKVPEKKTAKNRLHIDIAVKDVDAAATWVEELGGSKLQTVEERGTRWTVMADLDGNEFCLVTEEE